MLSSSLEHEGGDVSEKLTLAYAHSLMGYPTTWHVAAAYLAWCPCHGAEAMQQLLRQLPVKVSGSSVLLCCLPVLFYWPLHNTYVMGKCRTMVLAVSTCNVMKSAKVVVKSACSYSMVVLLGKVGS